MATVNKGQDEYTISNIKNLNDLIQEVSKIKKNIDNYKGENIIINENINSSEDIFQNYIDFSNCVFNGKLNIIGGRFIQEVLFENCIFNDDVTLTDNQFGTFVSFNDVIFSNETTDFSNIVFGGTTFFNNVNFSSKSLLFLNTNFKKHSEFSNAKFYNNVNFEAEFKENVRFDNAKFLGDNINFSGSTFEKNIYFHHCEFHHWVEFENTTFNKLVDFYDAKFFAPQQFHLTDFMDRAIFSDATFDKEAQFIHCKVESSSTINFHSTTFNKGLDISRSNFNLCKVSFWDIRISGLNEALSSELYKNNFGDNEYLPSVPKKLRESMRFIKNNFYAENNQIEGLEFYKKEMDVYEKEIKNDPQEETSSVIGIFACIIVSILLCIMCPLFIILFILCFIGTILYYGNDLFSLYLNKLSNNFGTSWIRGIVFTIFAEIITFLLMAIISKLDLDFSVKGFERMINNFLKIINLLDTKPFEEKDNNKEYDDNKLFDNISTLTYLVFILGRIFIGYGYYQTIQAFRKYGKS